MANLRRRFGASNTDPHRVFGCLGLAWKIRDEINKQMCLDWLLELYVILQLHHSEPEIMVFFDLQEV